MTTLRVNITYQFDEKLLSKTINFIKMNLSSLFYKLTMHHRLMYFFTILTPGFTLFYIEEYVIALLCLILQMTLIGWPIASIWGISTLKKYYKKQKHIEHQKFKEQHHD